MTKKFRNTIAVIWAACFVFGITACEEDTSSQQTASGPSKAEISEPSVQVMEESESSEVEPQETRKNVLVAYFSATETTKGVAEKIAKITDADLYEIVPAVPYSSEDLNYSDSQSRASVEMNDPDARPEIGSETIALDGYTTLYLGYPIWWGDAPRIMSTFAESYDLSGITVIPFCTSGSSDIGNSDDTLAAQAGGGTWITGRRFSGSVSESDLQAWIDELQEKENIK